MRYADSSTAYRYDRSLLERLMVTLYYLPNRFDSLGHSNIGQPYQSSVGNPSQVDQLSEVFVHSDEDPVL